MAAVQARYYSASDMRPDWLEPSDMWTTRDYPKVYIGPRSVEPHGVIGVNRSVPIAT